MADDLRTRLGLYPKSLFFSVVCVGYIWGFVGGETLHCTGSSQRWACETTEDSLWDTLLGFGDELSSRDAAECRVIYKNSRFRSGYRAMVERKDGGRFLLPLRPTLKEAEADKEVFERFTHSPRKPLVYSTSAFGNEVFFAWVITLLVAVGILYSFYLSLQEWRRK